MVPLLGLGSDQVSNACIPEKNIEACHLDRIKNDNRRDLRKCLQSLHAEEYSNVSMSILMSPQSLMKDSMWWNVLKELVKKDQLSMICID